MPEQMYDVLYVDDEASNLRIFRAAFRKYYSVHTARSGEEALQLLKERPVDIVVTDQRMPGMTGVEFLEKVIALYPDVVRIILTGFSDVEDIIYALNRCGVYRYLVKPWDREEMKHTLDKALEAVQLRKDKEALLERLKKVNSELEKRVEERTKELRKAKEKAEQASRAKQTFLSTMSHEIRTPLNAIVGTTNLLKSSELTVEQKENVEILGFSSQHLLSLINDILDLSKIESGKVHVEKAAFRPKEVLESIVKSFKIPASEQGLELNIHYQNNIPNALLGDALRLRQITTNLLSNAIKFTEKGSIEVRVAYNPTENNKRVLTVEVEDTGIGISEDKLAYIFEDFTQASADTTRKFGGTGLGLSISKRLVEMLKGSIQVESKLGIGSTFRFSIAFEETSINGLRRVAENGTSPSTNDDLKNKRILVAEDNLINQKVISKFLSLWNATVEIVENGEDALQKMQEDSYDLILMDLQMPFMDGYESAKRIRLLGSQYYNNIPIIALTASALSSEQDKVKKAGMDDFVVKPFDPEDLLHKIKIHLLKQEKGNL